MSDKLILYSIAFVLCLIGFGFTYYKVHNLGFPILPGKQVPVWSIGATITFEADNQPIDVRLSLPTEDSGLTILESKQTSDGYQFKHLTKDGIDFVEWTRPKANGKQSLYFKLKALQAQKIESNIINPSLKATYNPIFSDDKKQVADSVIKLARTQSSTPDDFTTSLIHLINTPDKVAFIDLLLPDINSRPQKAKVMHALLALSDIPSRLSMGLEIHSTKRTQDPLYFIEIFHDKEWQVFNPVTGEKGIPEGTILWRRGGDSLFDVMGGTQSSLTFSVVKSPLSAKQAAIKSSQLDDTAATFLDFSLYSLPVSSQKAFKTILLVPIGALIIAFLRILVGIRTSGTFMPILIALAFIQTQLLPGLIMFIAIVSVGLLIRFLLSSLNLLLVARISSVVIVVILIMAGFSIISTQLGINQVMTITFFPMIILAWTIERMSILWEEEGPKEVVTQGAGSLLMASVAYLAMSNEWVKHLTFNFPELLLVVLALLLLMGQYTGYRLTELYRFQPLTTKT